MNIEKALVVDDSKVAHLTLRKLLTERKIEVDWVGSGEDAMAYMERQHPDIIFMDVMMPGMDGFETTTAISKNAAGAPPIVMCSANATEEDRENAKTSGAVGFLSKPYTPAEMDDILNMVRALPEPVKAPPVVEEPAAVAEAPPAVEEPAPVEAPITTPPSQPVVSTGDIERVAERAAWSMADKVARDVATEITKSKAEQVARAVAEQAAQALVDEAGRKAIEAAIQAARETADKTAADTAASAAAQAVQASAGQVARGVAEQSVREFGEEIVKQQFAQRFVLMRNEMIKALEQQVAQTVQTILEREIKGQDFRQQLGQIMTETLLPTAESSARQTAGETVQEAMEETAGVGKRAGLALVVGAVALVVAVGAVALQFLP